MDIGFDKHTNKIMLIFKTIIDKQFTANTIANKAVRVGRKNKSEILIKFYGEDEQDSITSACISFGLTNLMESDFYIIIEILGYKYMLSFLQRQNRYLKIV